MPVIVSATFQIPDAELEVTYARSSGPGGQNVNKVNSKAVLRWNFIGSPSVPLGPRERFLSRFGNRLTAEGDLIIASDRHRDQGRNREDCLEKLRCLLLEIAQPPVPRRKTKPSRSSVRRAKESKRRHGDKKKQRGRVSYD